MSPRAQWAAAVGLLVLVAAAGLFFVLDPGGDEVRRAPTPAAEYARLAGLRHLAPDVAPAGYCGMDAAQLTFGIVGPDVTEPAGAARQRAVAVATALEAFCPDQLDQARPILGRQGVDVDGLAR